MTTTDAHEDDLFDVSLSETADEQVIGFKTGAAVTSVHGAFTVVDEPGRSLDYDLYLTPNMKALDAGANTFAVPRAMAGKAVIVQLAPRLANGAFGRLRRVLLTAPQPGRLLVHDHCAQ